ncbi:Transcriptional coactivator p15 [Sesbania bispinosa]|nr:Transcriptional coactivator p15 [Sesbania bispinosa]
MEDDETKGRIEETVRRILEESDMDKGASKDKEFDDEGDLIICKLSEKRKVTIQDFRGKTLVSIREFYRKDGKELPTSKEKGTGKSVPF